MAVAIEAVISATTVAIETTAEGVLATTITITAAVAVAEIDMKEATIAIEL